MGGNLKKAYGHDSLSCFQNNEIYHHLQNVNYIGLHIQVGDSHIGTAIFVCVHYYQYLINYLSSRVTVINSGYYTRISLFDEKRIKSEYVF